MHMKSIHDACEIFTMYVNISSSYCVIVQVRVVLKRTVVGDWTFQQPERKSSSESSE